MGIARLSFKKFLIYTTLGSIPWTFAFVYVGYALGNNWTVLSDITSKLKLPIRIILLMILLSFIYKKIKKFFYQKKRVN